MFTALENLAAAAGFARLYALPPADLSAWREIARARGVNVELPCDVPALYPWARSVLLLVWAYAPYPPDSHIPAYYIASNAGYHAHKALCRQIAALGCRCEAVELPARALALQNNVGVQGKNGLLRLDPYGSRIVLFTLLSDACDPQPVCASAAPCPPGCTACADACPTGAIGHTGVPALAQRRCLRYSMDAFPYPAAVWPQLAKHMGCERCMDACPFNPPPVAPDEAVRAAFDLSALARGEDAAARALVGKNLTRHGKLPAEARYFLARGKNIKT